MKKTKIIFIVLFFLVSITLSGCTNSTEGKTYYFDEDGNMSTTKPEPEVADKLEVYYFHSTARCVSCRTIGGYIKETMEQKYSKQIADGKIDYREINVDLPENKDVARKYQATGSSLFINKIIDGQDNIESDTMIWRLLSNEAQFKKHLEDKVNSYLGI